MPEPQSHACDCHQWLDGSFLIERYVYRSPTDVPGVQWLVHEVKDGNLSLVLVAKTRREAAEYVSNR